MIKYDLKYFNTKTKLLTEHQLALFELAVKNWNELNEKVNNWTESLELLCDTLGGHNLEDDLFDINYGAICATIRKEGNRLYLGDDMELWSVLNTEITDDMIACDITIHELHALIETILKDKLKQIKRVVNLKTKGI